MKKHTVQTLQVPSGQVLASIRDYVLSPVHSIDADAQLSINIKDTALTQAASFDVDPDVGIGFISILSIPASV